MANLAFTDIPVIDVDEKDGFENSGKDPSSLTALADTQVTRSSVHLGTTGLKYDLFQVDENSFEESISQASGCRSTQMETQDLTPSSAMGSVKNANAAKEILSRL